ncbi:uncharacterized protein LOC144160802 [Haemaphysalis longicornis]
MEFLKPPDPLRFLGDISRKWKFFIQKFNLFLASSETTDQKPRPESAKGALLLSIAGEEAIEVYNTFTFAEGESNLDYATVVKKFEEYCDAQQNEVYERYVFRKRVQKPGEPFEHFLRDLKTQARACNFGALTDSMVRDQIVFGTRDAKLREKLLADNKLTLENAEKTCKAAERAGLTFNQAKCTIGVEQIEFLGDVIGAEGIRPSPSLIKGMIEMPPPADKLAVQRMLGVVNYFAKFVPSLTEKTTLLRSLIKNDAREVGYCDVTGNTFYPLKKPFIEILQSLSNATTEVVQNKRHQCQGPECLLSPELQPVRHLFRLSGGR